MKKKKFFNGNFSHGFAALFTGKAIMNVATGFFTIFLPIFLFNFFGESVEKVVLYYLAGSVIYGLLVAVSARFMNKFGFRRALRVSTFLGAIYYLSLFLMDQISASVLVFFSLAILSLWRLLYWVPYHVDFAKFTDRKNRGKEVGLLGSTLSLIGIFAPIVAGFIVAKFGFGVLFFMGIVIYLLSFIPLLTLPHTEEKFSWNYGQTWKQFFSKEHQKNVLAFIADGAESAVGVVIWPIFIFQLLKGDYLEVGAISAVIVAITVVLQIIVGKYSDHEGEKTKFLKWGSLLSSVGWLLKIFIATAFHIFLVDSFHKLTKIFLRVPFDAMTYEIAADQGHYVDEFTVLHEIAIAVGKVLMFSIVLLALYFVSLNWVFIFAALASVVLSLISVRREHWRKV